jgi:hypothetical protein
LPIWRERSTTRELGVGNQRYVTRTAGVRLVAPEPTSSKYSPPSSATIASTASAKCGARAPSSPCTDQLAVVGATEDDDLVGPAVQQPLEHAAAITRPASSSFAAWTPIWPSGGSANSDGTGSPPISCSTAARIAASIRRARRPRK